VPALLRKQERARWGRILEALRLVPRQEEALLALRKQHLSKLHQIYHQRQSLNMQVGRAAPPRRFAACAACFLQGSAGSQRQGTRPKC
jgi:hypothetical protein